MRNTLQENLFDEVNRYKEKYGIKRGINNYIEDNLLKRNAKENIIISETDLMYARKRWNKDLLSQITVIQESSIPSPIPEDDRAKIFIEQLESSIRQYKENNDITDASKILEHIGAITVKIYEKVYEKPF